MVRSRRLADEAAITQWLPGWGDVGEEADLLQFVAPVFRDPVLIDRPRALKALGEAEHAAESDDAEQAPVDRAISVLRPLVNVVPSGVTYLEALRDLPPGVAADALRTGYHRAANSADDFLAWQYLLFLEELGEATVLKPLLKERLVSLGKWRDIDRRFVKAGEATYEMARRVLLDDFEFWWHDEVLPAIGKRPPGINPPPPPKRRSIRGIWSLLVRRLRERRLQDGRDQS
ncbi:hypothetical protein E0H75_07090 [Kribbella capetownensis]|uniref:Uncharacterized protein n=1 Tax=Kribbella capetownensis TaxID=1572659 RepID=A0A4R0K1T6_9ACTN|nr:hypothetical protein [Kribbella capetownensis]TCC53449.1 hypothetical protein E0H75_07090 [Kribbella capetownensis]